MSSYAHITLIDGFVDAVANLVCGEGLHSWKEVGVFRDIRPTLEHQTVQAAIRNDDGYLGLASWSLTPLYIEGKKRLQVDTSDFRAASALLLAAPDYFTAWNVRKRGMTPDQLKDELQFCSLVLMRSPKSAETWSHRSWVLRTFGCTQMQAQNELELAWVTASRAANNYYAGVHRLKVVQSAANDFLVSELERSRAWLRRNISDSSGWWYHRQLVTLLTAVGMASLDKEVAYSLELFQRYKDSHQCVRVQWTWVSSLQKTDVSAEPKG